MVKVEILEFETKFQIILTASLTCMTRVICQQEYDVEMMMNDA